MTGHGLAARRPALELRAYCIQKIRQFFIEQGYLEVDTPLLIPAPAPELFIDAIPCQDGFLQTSPELCMKRMLAAGYDRIYQISHCWRAGERGSRHLPEFTMLEWYRSHSDYTHLMDECEELIRFILDGLPGKYHHHGATGRLLSGFDLSSPWQRITLHNAFERHAGISLDQVLADDRYEEILTETVEPALGIYGPCFLTDFPSSMAALARLKPGNPAIAERFELYIKGVELANAFSELTDKDEQEQRFIAESNARSTQGKTVYPLPTPFLESLSAMPPSAGIALGIDRLLMLLTGSTCIDEVVAFTPEEL